MAGDIYTVQSGDTLSAIAHSHGTTVRDLVRINGLSDPNRLSAGQKLHLSAETALAVCPLFLDAARNPIRGIKYRLQCGADTKLGTTQSNGLGDAIITKLPTDMVRIWAQIGWQGNVWKQIAQVQSGVGEKLVTLISPMLRIKAPLHPHPKDQIGLPRHEAATAPKNAAKHPRGTPQKAQGKPQSMITPGGPGIHSRMMKDKDGISREVLSEDLPDLSDCFAAYTGEKITEKDWSDAAARITCEISVVKAFAQVETGGRSGFWPHSGTPPLPKILYERYVFSTLTKHKYDASNADLSMSRKYLSYVKAHDPAIYKADKAIPTYVSGLANYQRFLKACLLDENAAIECCSWGAFQVLGENWRLCDFQTHRQFLKAAFTSERVHLTEMFVPYVYNRSHGALRRALIIKDWVAAARLYNGSHEASGPPGYKGRWIPYHERLEKAYEGIKRQG